MPAIVFISGNSMADAIGGIGRSYRTVFEKLGYEFIEINMVDKEQALQKLTGLVYKQVAFAFSFMAMGTDILLDFEDKKSADIWETLRVPYISLFGDTPAYFFDRHVLRPNNIALYGFPEHYAVRKRFPNINGPINTYPPVAIDQIPATEIDFKKKTEGVVIFLKNGNDPKKLKDIWSNTLPPQVKNALMDLAHVCEQAINHKVTTQIDDLVVEYFSSKSLDIASMNKLRLFIITQLDDYLRRVKSTMMVQAMLDMPVLLNGYNWDHIDFTGRRLQYVPGGHYNLSTTLIREALAIVDMSPNTGLAPHDRPLRAIGAHTLCLTNEQEFFSRELPHSEEFFFQFDKDSIQARIAGVMRDRQRSVDVGVAVAEAFTRKFVPENFAKQLIELAALMRFDQLPALPEGFPSYVAWPPTKI